MDIQVFQDPHILYVRKEPFRLDFCAEIVNSIIGFGS